MSKEIKILVPDSEENECIDIKVMSKGRNLVNYRLEIWSYPRNHTKESRAHFVKRKIDSYPSNFRVIEIGVDGVDQIPVLFQQMKSQKNV